MTDFPTLTHLQKALGHVFTDETFIARALTHSSVQSAHRDGDYERLEFLGDRVLNLVVADLLFHHFLDEQEGALAKRHSALVRTETLASMARDLNLGSFVILSESERHAGGADNENILADLMESVIAAIYLDGGYDVAKTFVGKVMGDRLQKMVEPPRDPKTALQEWTQSRGLGLPEYALTQQTGPDHAPVFTVRVNVRGQDPVTASSTSKKRAERDAARKMLDRVERHDG